MSAVVWTMLYLECFHVGGCRLHASTFATKQECQSAISEILARDRDNAICLPLAEAPAQQRGEEP